MSVRSASHQRFESVRSRRTSGGRGLRFLPLPKLAHRERLDHGREKPFQAPLCGDPNGLRLLPRRSRAAVFHLAGPGRLPSRVTGFGGAWDVIGWRTKRVLGNGRVGRVTSPHSPFECPMTPKTFAEQMRQARSKSPLLKREQALKQFAEVEAFLVRHSLRPSVRPSASGLKARDA